MADLLASEMTNLQNFGEICVLLSDSVITKWKFHKPSWEYCPPPGKDFVALNKGAILSGLTTAPEQQHFRTTHDIRIRQKEPPTLKDRSFKPPEGMTFGISTR